MICLLVELIEKPDSPKWLTACPTGVVSAKLHPVSSLTRYIKRDANRKASTPHYCALFAYAPLFFNSP